MSQRELTAQQRRIIRTIADLNRRGKPLNITAVKRSHPELIEQVYAVQPFWGWKRALEDAGIPYPRKARLEPYVKCERCKQYFRSLSRHLRPQHGCDANEYRRDYSDAELMCEELRAKQMKQGNLRLLPHWEPIWTPEYVLDRIAEFQRRGFALSYGSVSARDAVCEHASHYFGSWDAALQRVGIDPRTIRLSAPSRSLDRQAVIAEILARRKRGQPLYPLGVRAGEHMDNPLWRAALQHFGTWRAAVQAAGIDPKQARYRHPSRIPTRASVTNEIIRRKRMGLPIAFKAVKQPDTGDKRLFVVAKGLFGSWRKAVEAAGLDYNKITVRPPNPYQSKTAVLNEIRRRKKAGLSVFTPHVLYGKNRDSLLFSAALTRFGRWSKALKAANRSSGR